MVFPFIIGGLGLAVGAVAGAFVAHAVGEKDRQAAKHHRTVANELTQKYADLEQRYYELTDSSQKLIGDLTRQHALDEMEKDLLRLALRLQQHLMSLMYDIDRDPTLPVLRKFKEAVDITNGVLCELNEELIFVPSYYWAKNKVLAVKREQLLLQ